MGPSYEVDGAVRRVAWTRTELRVQATHRPPLRRVLGDAQGSLCHPWRGRLQTLLSLIAYRSAAHVPALLYGAPTREGVPYARVSGGVRCPQKPPSTAQRHMHPHRGEPRTRGSPSGPPGREGRPTHQGRY